MDKGGIYLIQYKDDLSIYYIGRAKNFKKRVKDKFHLGANLVGWDKFNSLLLRFVILILNKKEQILFNKVFTFIKYCI